MIETSAKSNNVPLGQEDAGQLIDIAMAEKAARNIAGDFDDWLEIDQAMLPWHHLSGLMLGITIFLAGYILPSPQAYWGPAVCSMGLFMISVCGLGLMRARRVKITIRRADLISAAHRQKQHRIGGMDA